MPRFHYGKTEQAPSRETDELANYFAARDRAEFPYQAIEERRPSYLAERSKAHPNYLAGRLGDDDATRRRRASSAMRSAQSKPSGTGPTIVNGPDLRQVAPRFRPGYLEEWLANPRRLVPYTAMPQNIVPHGAIQMPVPKTFENQPMEMVRAIRDTLLNYVDAVELQLAGGGGPKTAAGTRGRVRRQDVERDSVTRPVRRPAFEPSATRRDQPMSTSMDPQAGLARPGPVGHPGRRPRRLRRSDGGQG